MNKAKFAKMLKEKMDKENATAVPNEQTYVATAQEQAMAGNTQGAMDTMQYSVKNPANKDIESQSSEKFMKLVKALAKKKIKK
jgi:hypothetical protein